MKIDLCRFLRWKGFRADLEPDELAFVLIHNHVQYQCLHTCQPWGTDGDVAAPETCTSDRACWTGRALRPSQAMAAALERGPDRDDDDDLQITAERPTPDGSDRRP